MARQAGKLRAEFFVHFGRHYHQAGAGILLFFAVQIYFSHHWFAAVCVFERENRIHNRRKGFSFQLFATDEGFSQGYQAGAEEYVMANGLYCFYFITVVIPAGRLDHAYDLAVPGMLLLWFFYVGLQLRTA